MTDWATISSLATGGGTLVLAVATYGSVRSANRSARLAEQTLLAGVRPVIIPSREDDPEEHVRFGEGVILAVPGHGAAVKLEHDVVYLAIALRNGGTGLAVLHGWQARVQPPRTRESSSRGPLLSEPLRPAETGVDEAPDSERFRRQQLDLYIPAGETGFWQGALRDPEEPGYAEVRRALAEGERSLWIDLLYGDYQGGQRTIVRMGIAPWPDTEGERAYVLRYFNLDRDDPR
ncbi:MAG: hypothetical protein JOZ07_02795 [Solirubrobacterales bacterium]|nr:hypothetical protein [Solirubrobacterales bacterium]